MLQAYKREMPRSYVFLGLQFNDTRVKECYCIYNTIITVYRYIIQLYDICLKYSSIGVILMPEKVSYLW